MYITVYMYMCKMQVRSTSVVKTTFFALFYIKQPACPTAGALPGHMHIGSWPIASSSISLATPKHLKSPL